MSKKSKCLRFIQNLSANTQRDYQSVIKQYEEFHNMTIEELVCEALDEQTRQVPHHLLKVIDRIEDFQEYLRETDKTYGTIVTLTGKIKTLYKKNRIDLPYLEPVNPKHCRKREYIEYKDVLTKEEIRKAMPYFRPPYQARASAMYQGGLSNEECEHLTTRSFIDELYKYHQCDNDIDALKWLSNVNHPVIWVTKLIRQKTKKPYYAILGAEAVNIIASAKLYERGLSKNNGGISEKLLDTSKHGFSNRCRAINDRLDFGKVSEESKLRSHNLRRFHATNLGGSVLNYEEQSKITNAEIDEMQGRGKTATQDTYIKTNPLRQKALYAKVMNNVSIYHEYDYVITDDDVLVFLRDPSSENKKLKDEVDVLSKKLHEKENASRKVQKLREELGDDAFNEMVLEILSSS